MDLQEKPRKHSSRRPFHDARDDDTIFHGLLPHPEPDNNTNEF